MTTAAVAILVCAASCQKDGSQTFTRNSREMSVTVSGGSATVKSSSPLNHEKLYSMPFVTDNGDTLSLDVFIADMPEEMSSPVMTKGQIITTENIPTAYGSFKTSVFKDGEAYTDVISGNTMTDVTVTYGEGKWTFVGGPYYWPHEDNLTFSSYSPVDDATGVSDIAWAEGGNKLTFNYSMPAAGMDGEGKYHDAENQKDLLFAIDTQNRTDHDNVARIEFSHALTAVRFIRGNIKDCTVRAIGLSGFYGAGSAEAEPNTDPDDTRKLSFTWTPSGDLQDFRQTFNVRIDDGIAHQDLEEAAITEGSSLDPTENQEYTFMIIPQEIQDASKLLVFIDERLHPIEVLLKRPGIDDKLKDWSGYAGKIITIAVSSLFDGDLVDIEISDTVTAEVKTDPMVHNAGSNPVFVRAAIVANWVTANGAPIAPYKVDGTTIQSAAFEGYDSSTWTYNGGFFYCRKVLTAPGTTGTPYNDIKLFTKFTSPNPPAGLPNVDHLEMDILFQAVDAKGDDAKSKIVAYGWPDVFVD